MYNTSYFAPNLAKTFLHARNNGGVSFDNLNKIWRELYAPDRRYKIWFRAVSTNHYIIRIGKSEFIVEFYNGAVYCRVVCNDLYDRKACFVCYKSTLDCIYRVEYQYDYLI